MMHNVTNMLESNNNVRCLMIDFSKAFDTVDHIVLVKKLQLIGLPDNIFNWLISFLIGRVQYCKVNETLSTPRNINLSTVQGSDLGRSLYVIMECDLPPQSQQNMLIKYADDTNLLVPEHTDSQLRHEFGHNENWTWRRCSGACC